MARSTQQELAALRRDVDRLQSAVAGAGAALSEGRGAKLADATRSDKFTQENNARRKGIRTLVQVGVAAIPGTAAAQTVFDSNPMAALVLPLALTPLIAYVQNWLEDHDKIPALLRNVGKAIDRAHDALDGDDEPTADKKAKERRT